MRVTVRVPATSANVGPGFDVFGLALELCNEFTIDTEGAPGVTWEGEGADELPTDGTDLVSTTIAEVATPRRAPVPFSLHARNRIPLERGLGSSSAATVAGVVLGRALTHWDDPHDAARVAEIAAGIEGHPDNAAPAAFGGFTVVLADGFIRRFDPHPSLRVAILVPDDVRLPTPDARRSLEPMVPRADAVFNAAHAALMVGALTLDPGLLSVALHDRLHQEARLVLVPSVEAVFDAQWARDVPTCVSGAGPSLLAFERDGHEVVDPGPGWSVLRPAIRPGGYEVLAGG